jgi:transposase
MRTFLRTRKQFVREKSSHILRIQKTLEDANIKLDSVITDIMGASGRKMIEALIAGEKDPAKLARLADPRVKASQENLREALRGRVTNSHRFLLRLHLGHIDALDAAIAELDREVEAAIAPFRTAVQQVTTTPGIKSLAARTILSEIGTDMSRFPTSGHLISWACICPRNDESAGKRRSTRIRKGSPWLKTAVRLGGDTNERHLPPRSIPPHQSAAWAEEGHPGRRGIDTYRHLPHAQGRNPVSGPRP